MIYYARIYHTIYHIRILMFMWSFGLLTKPSFTGRYSSGSHSVSGPNFAPPPSTSSVRWVPSPAPESTGPVWGNPRLLNSNICIVHILHICISLYICTYIYMYVQLLFIFCQALFYIVLTIASTVIAVITISIFVSSCFSYTCT